MPQARATLYLVDGSAQFHRAYFAIRGLSTSRGLPTNATYGFTTMLKKLLADEQPAYIGVAFDPPGRTFRHEQYPEYKAHRPKMDDDLAVQVPYVRRVCEVFRIPIVERQGFEADDVIATLVEQARRRDLPVVVVSADKDLLQLVGDGVTVLNPGRDGQPAVRFDAAQVEAKWGVPPDRIVDVLALVGDAVDNVPGVPGIGDKGAKELVRQFGPLEEVLAHAAEVKRASYREGLLQHHETALLSKQLVTLNREVAVTLDLDALARHEPDRQAARALFVELEFGGLAKEFGPVRSALATPESAVVNDLPALEALLAAVRSAGHVAVQLATTSREPMRAELLGLALSPHPEQVAFVPLVGSLEEPEAPLRVGAGWALIVALLEDPGVRKSCWNSKHERVVLARRGVTLRGVADDLLLMAYLLNPGRRSYSLAEAAGEFLGEDHPTELGLPKAEPVSASAATTSAAATLVARLASDLRARLGEQGLERIYAELELPLAELLAELELRGVGIDAKALESMSVELEGQLVLLTERIHALAGGPFNINSPVQLREVLFDHLGLTAGKKTAKTKAASTAEDVLEELAAGHDLPRAILDYRSVQKLKSTYVDALPALVHPDTGRIHALVNQTVAATGRLSTSDPNLQNIPIRTALGKRIRAAFVAPPGELLLSADYSQIELRVLAHLSGDETLIDTFRRGEDVHERTAREVFGAFSPFPVDEQRRVAKMVNYALLYGKTAFTLAKDLGVTKHEAETFIRAYFARYPRVRGYIDQTLVEARETGVVRTLLGRLRRLPDLRARNFQMRAEAERQAMNTPIQGTAADLIKKAMLDVARALAERGFRARLVLQIHDELLLEVPEAEGEQVLRLTRECMEGALSLVVPLVVDARLGRNWAEAH